MTGQSTPGGLWRSIDKSIPACRPTGSCHDLPPEEEKNIPQVCSSLDGALEALDKDREFLKAGGVFTDDFIDACIEVKMKEVTRYRASTHPLEFQMYYSL